MGLRFPAVEPPFPPPRPAPGEPPVRPLTNVEFLLFLLASLLGPFRGVPTVEALLIVLALALFGTAVI